MFAPAHRARSIGTRLTTLLLITAGLMLGAAPAHAASVTADHDPVIAGVAQRGAALTAFAGGYDVEPDQLSYQWQADGSDVGTDSPIYHPTADDLGTNVTVTVTATKAGYDDAVTTSGPTAPVADGGRIVGWGYNGTGATDAPSGLDGEIVTAVAGGGAHSLALTADGAVAAWGWNNLQQTEVPASLDSLASQAGATVTDIAAGFSFSLALTAAGTVVGWGSNGAGQTDIPPSLDGETVVAIAAGEQHALALTSDGMVVPWGFNGFGLDTVPPALTGKHVVAIAAGDYNSFALTSEGTLVGWGNDAKGQTTVPGSLTGETVVAVAPGRDHTLALTAGGTVVGWGDNTKSQTTVPPGLAGETVAIAAGAYHNVALTSDGSLAAWGDNEDLQLDMPAELTGDTVTALAAGNAHTLVIVPLPVIVAGGAPTITGSPVVGSTLGVNAPSYTPAAGALGYQWLRNGTPIALATAATYPLTGADLGASISVTITATKVGYRDAVGTSAAVGPVQAPAPPPPPAPTTFTAGPTATISGTAQVGQSLLADAGAPSPTPDALAYQWYADGSSISGASGPTLLLTSAQRGAHITVTITATKAGYTAASDTSEPTAAVGSAHAPTVQLTADQTQIRRGQSVTLSWTTDLADSLATGGDWPASGTPAVSGTLVVQPSALGTRTYTLSATNDRGTTTAQVSVTVVREAAELDVRVRPQAQRGQVLTVAGTGLDADEAWTIWFAGTKVASGTADDLGRARTRFVIPARAHLGRTQVRVLGSTEERSGVAHVRVLRPRDTHK